MGEAGEDTRSIAKNFTGPLPKPVTTFRRPSGHCAIITEADLVFFDRK